MLIQAAADAASAVHPLAGTAAEWLWALPLLPLVGFVLNGTLALAGAARLGPPDPSAASHDAPAEPLGNERSSTGTHADPEAGHLETGTTSVRRHRYAGVVSLIGPLGVIAAFGLACAMWLAMIDAAPATPFIQRYFSWMSVGDLRVDAAFQLDQLSMVLVLVITGVGALIHVFSVGYMRDDPGYPRYFAYLNLFVFFMLVLVLGANMPVTFVGWEGVGLCSYLLIGFWFSDRANADAGKKAFIANRVGDFGFLMAMFMLFANLGTLEYTGIAATAPAALAVNGSVVTVVCLFLLLGCAGKSAQIPLYVWLPDAMAGPTPVSALIHAATMVTAGVYLVVRTSMLFSLAPAASLTVCVIGATTALFAATIGLKQWDIKKVLAYSTISQLGFMFVAVGAGAYAAGIFHLVTHAFFKALLFLGAGSVIYEMHAAYHETHSHEDAQDMRNMGGLRAKLPVTWILMWIATLAIAGIPLFAGFFSKDEILGSVILRAQGSMLSDVRWLGVPGSLVLYVVYAMCLLAACWTAVYMTRLMLYTFHGPNRTGEEESVHLREAPAVMTGPLVVLGLLSAVGGLLNDPPFLPLVPTERLTRWLDPVVGSAVVRITRGVSLEADPRQGLVLAAVATGVAVLGILIAVLRLKPAALRPAREPAPPETGIERVLEHKYYVDEAYDRTIIRPIVALSRTVLWRGVDALIDGIVNLAAMVWRWLGTAGSALETGEVGSYAWALVLGVVVVLGAIALRA